VGSFVPQPDLSRRPEFASDHIVQLFDTADSLANVVSAFLNEGWLRGDHLLDVAKPHHWTRVAERLERRGCPVATATREGRLSVYDAATMLARISRYGVVDRQLFIEHVGSVVVRLATESPKGLRIYGEIVELLAEEGDLRSAQVLEAFWNELAEQQRFTLLCGYSAAHFADVTALRALHGICQAHTRVQKNTSDLLGNWLLQREQPAS
jgi:hypothetical protein